MGNMEEFPSVKVKGKVDVSKVDRKYPNNFYIETGGSDENLKVFDISINIFVNDKKIHLKNPSDEIEGRILILSGDCKGKEIELKEDISRIGRVNSKDPYAHNDHDIVFPCEQDYRFISRISKPHAEILFDGAQYFVLHAPNKNVINKTSLNGIELKECEKTPLKKGDIITVADVELRFF